MDKVDGVVVINNEGIPIKSTMDSTSTVQVYFPKKCWQTDSYLKIIWPDFDHYFLSTQQRCQPLQNEPKAW